MHEKRDQTLPETRTTASNKATNTSSLSVVSIGMPGSIFQSSLSSINPDTEPPKRGQSLPGWVLDMLHPAATG
jgi:hypothetical protein